MKVIRKNSSNLKRPESVNKKDESYLEEKKNNFQLFSFC